MCDTAQFQQATDSTRAPTMRQNALEKGAEKRMKRFPSADRESDLFAFMSQKVTLFTNWESTLMKHSDHYK